MSGQHCECYDVKWETVHCYPVNSFRWNLSAVFKFCFCFVLLYNKSLNDWSLGEHWILFPKNLNVCSRSLSRSHKTAYDLVKIENRSRKRCHKIDGIGVGRIRTFPFLPIPFTSLSLMIQWKLGCRGRKQNRMNQPIAKPGIERCHWFILPLLLATLTMQFSLFHLIVSNGDISRISVLLPTPSVWFSLDYIAIRFWLRLRLRLRR